MSLQAGLAQSGLVHAAKVPPLQSIQSFLRASPSIFARTPSDSGDDLAQHRR
jgi:hypothetical protein